MCTNFLVDYAKKSVHHGNNKATKVAALFKNTQPEKERQRPRNTIFGTAF